MEVFLVVVFERPTKKAAEEEGASPKIVVQPTAVIAKDATQAAMRANRLVPSTYGSDDDRLEVRVMPFRNA